jgi:ribosomal protein S18 acetylase RimI-like enzyme
VFAVKKIIYLCRCLTYFFVSYSVWILIELNREIIRLFFVCFLWQGFFNENCFIYLQQTFLLMKIEETSVMRCDYGDPAHLQAVRSLLNGYVEDEMGGGKPLSGVEQVTLTEGLRRRAGSLVLLAVRGGVFCGLLVAFENFSTFTVRPMMNIHDVFVLESHRGKGVGRRLMQAAVEEAARRNCSRVTLEVRQDNVAAQRLYKSMGFGETDPPMYYWRMNLAFDGSLG